MDYEFRRNTLDGSFHAELSMGHEALGRWLVDEVSTNLEEISEVLSASQHISVSGGEWQRAGKELHLTLSREEALVQTNAVVERELSSEISNDSHEQGDDLRDYDEESVSLCGLEDFNQVLNAWQDFIKRYGAR
ncbi:hypothetical protein CS022_15470 [Veronia nyctiphanis]|uniref:Uncharacterized protein n=1 Tax=Veronia nyctiphanis TaxID=1278244 RepID=A0A4Q0YPI5_9GAMM|nr:YacL family protein [Veronia nyctiphanis]RXJ72463.1 hypothetical protein CS022_15470 [Veronia nyctiphanis]